MGLHRTVSDARSRLEVRSLLKRGVIKVGMRTLDCSIRLQSLWNETQALKAPVGGSSNLFVVVAPLFPSQADNYASRT